MNHVEKLIKNFRETEKQLKIARRKIRKLEEREDEYHLLRVRMRTMKKTLTALEHTIAQLEQKIESLETKKGQYKRPIYPTQNVNQCGNKGK